MHFRGDWKYLRQIFCLRRHYGTEGICHCCSATKGKKDQTLNFTDLSDEAAWRATVFRCPPPWQVEPEFAKLDFFSFGDAFHGRSPRLAFGDCQRPEPWLTKVFFFQVSVLGGHFASKDRRNHEEAGGYWVFWGRKYPSLPR